MKIGAKVVVTAQWSSFYTMRGKVTQTTPHLMVLLEGDTHPIRVGEREVAEESEPMNLTGAE